MPWRSCDSDVASKLGELGVHHIAISVDLADATRTEHAANDEVEQVDLVNILVNARVSLLDTLKVFPTLQKGH